MRMLHLFRAHPWVSLVATLAFMLVLIVFWPQLSKAPVLSHDIPLYPGAENLSHEIPSEHGERFRTCQGPGEEIHTHTRITRFVTSDSPDVVLQFYRATLVQRGPYLLANHRYMAVIRYGLEQRIVDDGESGMFEYETSRDTTQSVHHNAEGYRVEIDTAPEAGWTTVQIIEYEYQGLGRACHPW